MLALRLLVTDSERDWDVCRNALTYDYSCKFHYSIGMKPADLVLSTVSHTLPVQEATKFASKAGLTETKRGYPYRLRDLLRTAT